MPRVLISAGHTVMDPGQIYGDLREADLTRKIAPKIIPYLQQAGVEVQGVPLDLPLLQRVEWINNTGYTTENNDVLIEVHVNDGGKRGIEAWFEGEGGNNSQKLAKVVVDTLCADTGYQNQGIHAEHEHELRSLTFLNRTKPAALLLETLYIDNPDDIALLKDETKLEELAKSIAKGILKYFGKDEKGQDLPEDQKPKFDDLKPVPRPAPAAMPGIPGFDDLDLDMDMDMFGGMDGSPVSPDAITPASVAPANPSPIAPTSAPIANTTAAAPTPASNQITPTSLPSIPPPPTPATGGSSLPTFGGSNSMANTMNSSMGSSMPGAGGLGVGGFGGGAGLGGGLSRPGGFGAGGMGMGGAGGSNNFMMDREQRREMIKKNYVKILGREPSQSDLNYFLNQGTAENDLVTKMLDSQEHLDLVKSKQQLQELEKKVSDQESELIKIKGEKKDIEATLENLQGLLQAKNKAINDLEQAVFAKHGVPSGALMASNQNSTASDNNLPTTAGSTYRPKYLERFYQWLSKKLAK